MAADQPRTRFATLLPGVGLAVLSKFTCSACLAAYSGLLASLGVGAAATDSGLTIVTAALLSLGFASVAWSTRGHRHPGPLLLAAAGSAVVLGGRLVTPATGVLLVGAALLLLGTAWNLWLERRPVECCARAVAHDEPTWEGE